METYCWGCWLCGIAAQPATDIDEAKAMLEAHEADAHKGKPVGSFGGSWKPEPLVPVWPKVPVKVFADGTYTVGGVLHPPNFDHGFWIWSAEGWKQKA